MPKSLRVKIPAVISSDGKWCAYGWPGNEVDTDWSIIEETADNGEPSNYRRVWITAFLPMPEETEVNANDVQAIDP